MSDPSLEFKILDEVHEDPAAITQRTISERLGCSIASVNFAVRLLAAKGFIKISGANPRKLQYHLTPKGVLQKSVLAYNFLKRQAALYQEVRTTVLGKLEHLATEGVRTCAIYGWTPFTETAMLYLISSSIEVVAVYVPKMEEIGFSNGVPFRLIEFFEPDCEVLVLMEPLPRGNDKIGTRKLVCHP
jgi:DNA-binding Lrp family transcriptional regulator